MTDLHDEMHIVIASSTLRDRKWVPCRRKARQSATLVVLMTHGLPPHEVAWHTTQHRLVHV